MRTYHTYKKADYKVKDKYPKSKPKSFADLDYLDNDDKLDKVAEQNKQEDKKVKAKSKSYSNLGNIDEIREINTKPSKKIEKEMLISKSN